MASKGQKFNKYSKEFRIKVINDALKYGNRYAAKKHNVNFNTVTSWYRNYQKGILNTKKGPNSPRDLNYYKERYEILKKLHDFYNSQNKTK